MGQVESSVTLSRISYFAERYRVIALDLRGHGKSDKPPGPYSSKLFANEAVMEFVSKRGCPVSTRDAGTSFAGGHRCLPGR